jgi:hypothetical protein
MGAVRYHNSPSRAFGYVHSLCTVFFFFSLVVTVSKAQSTTDLGSMPIHQGLPIKARRLHYDEVMRT